MRKAKIFSLFLIAIIFQNFFTGCNSRNPENNFPSQSKISSTILESSDTLEPNEILNSSNETQVTSEETDYSKIKPNEAGKIMIVMFHNFVEAYKSGDKHYTTTFDDFRKLLQTLYDSDFRMLALNDYLDNRIDTEAGFKPIIFTFDDGTSGQFNLIKENGVLSASKQSAVGIMEEFNRLHPDFGLEGTFFVNLGDNTFNGSGTMEERLGYLTGKGFELGNHTYSHINLKKVKDSAIIQKEIGKNQKKMYEYLPGYRFIAFSLPFGLSSQALKQFVVNGIYEGIEYENKGIMEVGWDPALSPADKKFDPYSIHRIRASGIVPVEADLAWWLKNSKPESLYVSDGKPNIITVPEEKRDIIDMVKLEGKGKEAGYELIVY